MNFLTRLKYLFAPKTNEQLAAENAELRALVRSIYSWTKYKNTAWARRAKAALH